MHFNDEYSIRMDRIILHCTSIRTKLAGSLKYRDFGGCAGSSTNHINQITEHAIVSAQNRRSINKRLAKLVNRAFFTQTDSNRKFRNSPELKGEPIWKFPSGRRSV
jgi:hypothetical protein